MQDAREMLHSLNHSDVVTIATIQTGHQLLTRQASLIKKMVEEGFVDAKMAEVFYSVIDHDIERLHVLKHEREKLELLKKRTKNLMSQRQLDTSKEKRNFKVIADIESGVRAGNHEIEHQSSDHGSSDGGGSVHLDRRYSDSRIELSKFRDALLRTQGAERGPESQV